MLFGMLQGSVLTSGMADLWGDKGGDNRVVKKVKVIV